MAAFATAMAISGMPSGRFTFEGFLSVNKPSRREHLEEVKNERRTMIFYEAPHKLAATLKDMYNAFGDRKIAIVKELTKIHESVELTTLSEASEKYTPEASIKGEFVLVIEGAKPEETPELTLDEAVRLAKKLVEDGMGMNYAAKQLAKDTKYKKSDIYKALLED